MKRELAITGNIGAGKSKICEMFANKYDIPVYDCDKAAYNLLNTNKELIFSMQRAFGDRIYKVVNHEIIWNKEFVIQRIMPSSDGYTIMNSILQPFVLKDYMQWRFEQLFTENSEYVIMENAILIESGIYKLFDNILDIDAPVETRYHRYAERFDSTNPMIRARFDSIISKQISTTTKQRLCDNTNYIRLINDDGVDLTNEISQIHSAILNDIRNDEDDNVF